MALGLPQQGLYLRRACSTDEVVFIQDEGHVRQGWRFLLRHFRLRFETLLFVCCAQFAVHRMLYRDKTKTEGVYFVDANGRWCGLC